ncbi:MAG: hypothetical protein HY619_07455 [Thaumarchaeota archaeon]|nr:hypothetical protein [Nitrososphaerota archaeon]
MSVSARLSSNKDGKTEGLGPAYLILGAVFSLLGSGNPVTRLRLFRRASSLFDSRLQTLRHNEHFLDKESLTRMQLLKQKYPTYAIYLAIFGSQAALSKIDSGQVVNSVMAKTSMAVSTKVMDNLSDEWETAEEAFRSTGYLMSALTDGMIRPEYEKVPTRWIDRAESSALEMASWAGHILGAMRDSAPFSYKTYVSDVKRWVEGQQSSFMHHQRPVSMQDYLAMILEKSTGNLWADPDLIVFESTLGCLDGALRKRALSIRAQADLLIKSCLLYDDVVDFYYDVEHDSVNALLLLAEEKGVAWNARDLARKPHSYLRLLYEKGIVDEVLALGDRLFVLALNAVRNISYEDALFDRRELEYACHLLRLFNLRKLVNRDRDLHALKVCLSVGGVRKTPEALLPADTYDLDGFLRSAQNKVEQLAHR